MNRIIELWESLYGALSRPRSIKAGLMIGLLSIELAITLPFFLLSWWGCALYQSVILGWVVSKQPSKEKRETLAKLMSPHADAS